MFIYDAAMRYRDEGVPLMILAGKEYGSGSSRDWAAKGTLLLGVRAVLAESYERIHRSNLVGMGVLPLQFMPGRERGVAGPDRPRGVRRRRACRTGCRSARRSSCGSATRHGERMIEAICRLDGPVELDYYRQGGIIPAVLRRLAQPATELGSSHNGSATGHPITGCFAPARWRARAASRWRCSSLPT